MYEMKTCSPGAMGKSARTEKEKVRESKWYAAFGVQLRGMLLAINPSSAGQLVPDGEGGGEGEMWRTYG